MKTLIIIAAIFAVCFRLSFGADMRAPVELERIIEDISPDAAAGMIQSRGGELDRAIAWTLDNLIRADGWQLTGWSRVELDGKLNRCRVKIGITSGETEALRLTDLNRRGTDLSAQAPDWAHRAPRGITVGFHFVKEF